MAITEAFCIELNKKVDIYEAIEEFFSQDAPFELTFLCPDNDCRKEFAPRITGVNYKKMPGIDPIKNRPHFRANFKSIHSPNCSFVEISEAIEELEKEGEGKPRNFKKHGLVDVFSPHTETEGDEEEDDGDHMKVADKIKKISDKPSRINLWKEVLKKYSHRTSKLEEVVSCFLSMDAEEAKETYLTIPDVGKRTYRQHFKATRYARPDGQNRIYYGYAKISLWKNKRYYFNFTMPTLDELFPDAEVSTYITLDQIHEFRGGKFLKAQLEICRENTEEICLFVFGTAEEIPNQVKKLHISFDSLHSIAIRTKDELPER